jgi:hypothetical protein
VRGSQERKICLAFLEQNIRTRKTGINKFNEERLQGYFGYRQIDIDAKYVGGYHKVNLFIGNAT